MAGNAIFTTEPSINAMLDPRIVAARVRGLYFCDNATGKVGVARMTPVSHGGRVKPTIWASKKSSLTRRDPADCTSDRQGVTSLIQIRNERLRSISLLLR